MEAIRIGHPAYPKTGYNRARWHSTYAEALADLLTRGVSMKEAHAALAAALKGRLATAPRYHKGTRVESCEVIAD